MVATTKQDLYVTSHQKQSSSFSKINLYNKDAEKDDYGDQEEDDDDHSPQQKRLKNLMVPNRQFHHDGQQDYATQFQKYKGKKNKFQFNS